MEETISILYCNGLFLMILHFFQIRGLIDDAVKKGAKVELGGKSLGPTGCSFEPTLITGVTNDMEIAHTEIFGPVITIR